MDKEGIPLSVRRERLDQEFSDPANLIRLTYQLYSGCADFHLYINTPRIEPITPPIIITPEQISETNYEHVYDIQDHGYRFSTSRAKDFPAGGNSMCKLFFTIEKMIGLLIERLKTGGITQDDEVQVGIQGYIKALRKAFESIINLPYNVVIVNFEPEEWGDKYLKIIEKMAEKGYGYPSETPRDLYKKLTTSANPKLK